VTANQLFNIREIKRTFPLISSGNLVADVLSGFSVYLLLNLVGLNNVLFLSFLIMVVGSGVLLYISHTYSHAFPDSVVRQAEDNETPHSAQRMRGSMGNYVVLLLAFFVIAQILMYLIEFEYLGQLERNLGPTEIAGFLGIFSGLLGLVELITQWFTSSRLIERQGVFTVTAILPFFIVAIGLTTLASSHGALVGVAALFVGLIILKFFDEWLRYTLVASTRPILFQPIPDSHRTGIQSLVGGIAEPLSMGFTGVIILGVIGLCEAFGYTNPDFQSQVFLI
jgi:ATP/ADP translocase